MVRSRNVKRWIVALLAVCAGCWLFWEPKAEESLLGTSDQELAVSKHLHEESEVPQTMSELPSVSSKTKQMETRAGTLRSYGALFRDGSLYGNRRVVIPLLLTSLQYHGSSLLATTLEGWVKKFLIPQKNIDLIIFYDHNQVELEKLLKLLRLKKSPFDHTADIEEMLVNVSLSAGDSVLLGKGYFLTPFDDTLTIRVHPVVTPLPDSILQNLTRLADRNWMRCGCPPVCPEKRASVDYIQGTRWYTYDLFLQPIVHEYSFWIKLDVDIWFFRPFPFNVVDQLIDKGAIFAHTGHIYNGNGCSNELHQAIDLYTRDHNLVPVSEGQSWWKQDDNVYYSNFVVSSMAFHLSREHMKFAHYLNEYPTGFFKYRWTDQSLFHKVFGVFFGPQQEDFALDWTNLRWSKKFTRRDAVFYHSKGFKSARVLRRTTPNI